MLRSLILLIPVWLLSAIGGSASASVVVGELDRLGASTTHRVGMFVTGTAGDGLLGGNENPAVTGGGSGGLGPGGISYNTITRVLSIDVRWGSANGFTDLTGDATAMHIHGPTASGGNASFGENAAPLIGLDNMLGFDSQAADGGFFGSVLIPEDHVSGLLAGSMYLNVHTAANLGGEIRGNLQVIPEPGTISLMSVALMGLAGAGWWRRRRMPTTAE